MPFDVQSYELAVTPHPASKKALYEHQIAVWDAWDKQSTILLTAGTGTGKTLAAMLPVLKKGESAIAIYPTNELLGDQVRSIERFAAEEETDVVVWTPEVETTPGRANRYSAAHHILVPIDALLLDRWQKIWHCENRGEALRRLLNPDKPKIIFTNPDILFLIMGLCYHAEPFENLRHYGTLIVDEFHLYAGVELAHALAMVSLARGFDIFRRLVLLSATPPEEIKTLLDRALNPATISASSQPGKHLKTAVYPVEVKPLLAGGKDPVELLHVQIVGLKPTFEKLRDENPRGDYLPAVVIVNSVVNAIRLEDRLVESGFDRERLAIIRGLSHRAIRQTKGKLLALGTSAIEVGVDFHCDYLLFEASDDASFLQRFGRVGRHRPGKAIALVPPNALAGMESLPPTIARSQFEERVQALYPSRSAYAWFVTTEEGMITARALSENLITTVERSGDSNPQLIAKLRERVEAILTDHARRMGCESENESAKMAFARSRAGKKHSRWLETYRKLNRFRTSMPRTKVHDFTEHHRRQDWEMGEYDVDIATLMRRGVGLAWNEKVGMLTIRGIGKYRRVHASELFEDIDVGVIFQTEDYRNLSLYQDDELTPVSELMAQENHIFIVVPKAEVENSIDWRLMTFESGRYLLAFDGAALLLRAVHMRRLRQESATCN